MNDRRGEDRWGAESEDEKGRAETERGGEVLEAVQDRSERKGQGMPYSIDGPWTREEEDELLGHYGFERVEGLDEVWELLRPGPKGVRVFARAEALGWIRQVRRVAYGMGG